MGARFGLAVNQHVHSLITYIYIQWFQLLSFNQKLYDPNPILNSLQVQILSLTFYFLCSEVSSEKNHYYGKKFLEKLLFLNSF